jgi:putative SOS response-associated peptidase YedK
MSGRFVLDRESADVMNLFDVDTAGEDLPGPSWNIAPTMPIAIVLDSLPRATEDEPYPEPLRRLEAARFGLVPGFSKGPDDGPALFNARSEGAAASSSFANAVATRRAVIPASGYFEWKSGGADRVPHFVFLPGDELLVLAGLFEWWRNPAAAEGSSARWLLSASILTRAATGAVAEIHERMPVFLDADMVEGWLDPQETGSQDLVDEVASAAAEVAARVQFHEVGREIQSLTSTGPQLIAPV